MGTSTQQPAMQKVDLREYAKEILVHEDHPLFDEAVEAAKAGALRSAYVMIWLACAESLKRRFREAKKRDDTAGKIVGEIERLEKEHKAVDLVLLQKALRYGFVSDSGQTALGHIYEMRCIYGHPYEEAPSREKVIDAAATVVNLVLSKPVKLRHGFGNQLLKSLLENGNYLDDQESAVADFARRILPGVDEDIHVWLLDEYCKEMENLSNDSSMAVFVRRGIWFCRTMLAEIGVATLTNEQWHERASRFPQTLTRVCNVPAIFEGIGELAQNSLVGSILDKSKTRSSVLTHLERLNGADLLSERQQERFIEHISQMEITDIRASGLSTKACYAMVIEALQSSNWYTQNPAIRLVLTNGPGQAAELAENQQVNLGRNVLQAGEGGARSARGFLESLAEDATSWPLGVVRGVALESFTNENNDIRPKDRRLGLVLSALSQLDDVQRDEIIAAASASVDAGTPREWVCREDFGSVFESLNSYTWAEPLVRSLDAKFPAEQEREA